MASDNRSVSAVPSPTSSPTPIPDHDHHLTNGALAAAIAVPVLTVLSVIVLLFFCLRRRTTSSLEGEPAMPAAAGIKEKLGSFRRRPKPPPPPPAAATEPPILTSEQNNAYYTGLDTSSLGSRGDSGEYQPRASYEPPPPPYIREPSPQEMRTRSPFDDPPHNHSIADSMRLAPFERPDTPHSTSTHSVTSTQYSDDASVHEAKEARRSIGGAQIVDAMSITSAEGARSGSDPFVSPMGSPTSAARAGGEGLRRASDVSEMERP